MDITIHGATNFEVRRTYPKNGNSIEFSVTRLVWGGDGQVTVKDFITIFDLPSALTEALLGAIPKSPDYINHDETPSYVEA